MRKSDVCSPTCPSAAYYGFKGHVLTSDDGFILAFGVAAANVDERAMLLEMSASATPYVLGDSGMS